MRNGLILAVLALSPASAWARGRSPDIPFAKHTIDLGANETCAVADVNGDGLLDIVSGENWFEAPGWKKHTFRELHYTNNYIDNFSDLILDVNGDGRPDVISCAWFSRRMAWFENPGAAGGTWKEHAIDKGFNIEFCILADLDNDGRAREVLPQFGNQEAPLAWYELSNGAFTKHVVSSRSYGHGIGAGDVNGDRRTDILTPQGWFEAPADPRTGSWTWHPEFDLGSLGFLHVLDVNEDGRNDIVSSMAHDYGIFWLENQGAGQWKKNPIDEAWSQAHAVTLADLNGDGRPDLVTGKRFNAHNGHDPGDRDPLGVYWYEYRRTDDGKSIEWVRHVVDYSTRTGGGMQIPVVDLDGDGDLDFVTAGKSGVFLFENLTRSRK